MKKTTEQLRAKAAWGQVYSLSDDEVKEFSPEADGAAALIQQVGFGQAIAFWLAKGNNKEVLALFLAQWLLRGNNSESINPDKSGKDLMECLISIPSSNYRHLTNEAMAYLNWLKRFAKARKK